MQDRLLTITDDVDAYRLSPLWERVPVLKKVKRCKKVSFDALKTVSEQVLTGFTLRHL